MNDVFNTLAKENVYVAGVVIGFALLVRGIVELSKK